jgi:hypothetical protein
MVELVQVMLLAEAVVVLAKLVTQMLTAKVAMA